jgi:hypothetical protein
LKRQKNLFFKVQIRVRPSPPITAVGDRPNIIYCFNAWIRGFSDRGTYDSEYSKCFGVLLGDMRIAAAGEYLDEDVVASEDGETVVFAGKRTIRWTWTGNGYRATTWLTLFFSRSSKGPFSARYAE